MPLELRFKILIKIPKTSSKQPRRDDLIWKVSAGDVGSLPSWHILETSIMLFLTPESKSQNSQGNYRVSQL